MTGVSGPRRGGLLAGFLRSETAGGLLLIAVAALALGVSNSPLGPGYFALLHADVAGLSVLHGVNDGLMALFFLLVGLEIKREALGGELSTWSHRALPGLAALGGIVVPALIYVAVQRGDPVTTHGWATPAATDIAFSLAVLSLVRARVPASLRVFLTALAIIDDLGAVLIIAVAYTGGIEPWAMAGAGACVLGLVVLNRLGVTRLLPYLFVGALLWEAMRRSGVHATIAGVVLALAIPIAPNGEDAPSPLHRLEHALQPWVAFLVIPVFGFANAGVRLVGLDIAALHASVPLGVALGLFVGKPVGVLGASWLAIRAGVASLPEGAKWRHLGGVAVLCGIGFTMSLFIGLLAFAAPDLQDATKIGVLAGSLASGLVGGLLLRLMPKL